METQIIKALFFLTLLLSSSLSSPSLAAPMAVNHWAFPDRDYRLLLTVAPDGHQRTDKVVEIELDFAAELATLGVTGIFDEKSVRLTEVSSSETLLDDQLPFQFDNGINGTGPEGTLVFRMDGTTNDNESRYFHLYFDTAGSFTSPPAMIDQVLYAGSQMYRGQTAWQIETFNSNGAAQAEYWYQRDAGAFASIFDKNNNDWISFYPDSGSQSAGEYRGIPNMESTFFHPGASNATSSRIEDGPLRLSIRSTSGSGANKWETRWDIFPTYARMTVVDVPTGSSYWFLYEGTPGGNLEYTGSNQDEWVRSDSISNEVSNAWPANFDLTAPSPSAPGEWVYFVDSQTDRMFYVAHSEDDNQPDMYRHQDNGTTPPGTDNGAMTVFGFGRNSTGLTRYLTAVGAAFTIGFGEDSTFDGANQLINGAYQPLTITMGEPERNPMMVYLPVAVK